MKKNILFSLLLFSFSNLKSQNVENPSFDSVYIGGIDRIYEWITSDSWGSVMNDTVIPMNPNTHYVSSGLQYHETFASVQIDYSTAYHGPHAVKLLTEPGKVKTDGSTFRGFVVNGNHFYTDSLGYIDLSKCGMPFTHRPYSLKGQYKFEDTSPSLHNYPTVNVLLRKYNSTTQVSDTIGYGVASIQLYQTPNWRAFEIPIIYLSNQVPDTIVVALQSASLADPSTFWVDSLNFNLTDPTLIEEQVLSKHFYQVGSKIYFLQPEKIKQVEVLDINARRIINLTSSFAVINLENLPQGNYLLRTIFFDKRKTTFKIKR